MRRLREATRIVHDESKLEAYIKDLKQSIEELKQLRQQTEELRKPFATTNSRRTIRMRTGPEYSYFRKTKEASKALHEALTMVWSRSKGNGSSHEMQHIVRLFLHTNVEEDVNMNAAISCNDHLMATEYTFIAQGTVSCLTNKGISGATREVPIRVKIRSQYRDPLLRLPTPSNPSESSSSHGDRRKKRKVKFAEAGEGVSSMDQNQRCCSSDKSQVVSLPPNLSVVDLCSVLYRNNIPPSDDGKCFGYLDGDVQGKFRYHFSRISAHNRAEAIPVTSDNTYETLIPMSEALNQSAERSITVVDQLKVAREIASAVLKLHATPWLKEYFNIYDLMLYSTGHSLTTSLKTLHVASDFIQTKPAQEQNNADATSLPTPLAVDDALDEAKLRYGVRNLALWSLGAILLQVGQWSTLESLEDVVTVRKLSMQASNLGPRYRDLTKRCLDCDFGYGDDLTKPRLQQAVYEGLVGELSEMISTLDVEED